VKQFAGAMHTDLIDGVDWAVKQGIVNRRKMCVYGGSYGGYATLVSVTFTPKVFTCAVDYVGPSSLITLVESFPPYWRPFLEEAGTASWVTRASPTTVRTCGRAPRSHESTASRPRS